MDIIEAIKTRKSIRAFKPDPVSKKILWEILEVAGRAPSSLNSQPWEFTVIAGDALNNVKQDLVAKVNKGEPIQPDHSVVGWPSDSVYRKRQVELAIKLFSLMGIQREDKEKRAQWMERGFLAALHHGLCTCIEDQGVMYPDVVRKFAGIPESKRIIISIAIGYPNWDFPANKLESPRESVENNTTWIGFE